MTALAISHSTLRTRLDLLARIFAILTAVSLPWSTSATSIGAGLWFVALLPTLEWSSLRKTLSAPAAYIPVALAALAVAGMLWADVTWSGRASGLVPFARLLAIPLLMWQFSTRENGEQVLFAFFISACVLLGVSWFYAAVPQLSWDLGAKSYGIPVKDYISQSGIFTLCAFALLERALAAWKRSRGSAVPLVILACAFLANIIFIALARTSLVVIVVLFVLLGLLHLSRRGFAIFVVAGIMLAALSWNTSGYLRERVTNIVTEIQTFSPEHDTSSGARLAFWKDSLEIMRDAPVLGNGTGSVREMFSRQAGVDMTASGVAHNPHNQIFAVAIQLGAVGALVLIAMWIVHVRLFLRNDMVGWVGLMVVAQNIVGSLFNSHLFDFTQGWLYVFGVGVAGGLVLRNCGATARQAPAPTVAS